MPASSTFNPKNCMTSTFLSASGAVNQDQTYKLVSIQLSLSGLTSLFQLGEECLDFFLRHMVDVGLCVSVVSAVKHLSLRLWLVKKQQQIDIEYGGCS